MTTTNGEPERRPILFITIGRQRVGKTTTLNTIVQFVHARGGRFVVWNGDRLNQTYNLAQFHKDVVEPPTAGFDEVQVWLEDRIRDQVQHGYDAVLDIGGGETPLNRLMEELPFVQSLERRGIRVVVAHIVGPEKADLDYLSHFSGHQLVAPEATLIVLNAGLVMSGRSAISAFTAVFEHKALKAAVVQGARTAMMPLLSCMSQVTDRGLTFAEAIIAGDAIGADGFLANMATPDMLKALSKAALERVASAQGVAPRNTAKETRAALIAHVGEGSFVLPAAQFALTAPELAELRRRAADEARYARPPRGGSGLDDEDDGLEPGSDDEEGLADGLVDEPDDAEQRQAA